MHGILNDFNMVTLNMQKQQNPLLEINIREHYSLNSDELKLTSFR
jgi:hypothetical protein